MLSPDHEAMLVEGSALSREIIAERGYRTTTSTADIVQLGFSPAQARVPGLLIPLHDVWGQTGLHVLRPDNPRQIGGRALKYEYPKGARLILDVPPRCRSALGDPQVELWITEGAKKADALADRGMCAISLNGVWAWRGKNVHGGKTALPDWEGVALNDREVVLAFDSDVVSKPQVRLALTRLAQFLRSRGAR